MTGEFKSRVVFISWAAVATISGVAIAWNARFLLLLLFAGCIFALLLETVVSGLQKLLKIRYALAYALTLTSAAVVLGLSIWLRGPALLEQADELRYLLPGAVKRMVMDVEKTELGAWVGAQISGDAQASRAVGFLISGIGGATLAGISVVGGAMIVILVTLYVSAEPDFYKRGVMHLIPLSHRPTWESYVNGAVRNLRFWLFARAVSMTIIGSLVTSGLWLLGIPLAGTLGLLTALLTFIPNLGPVLAAIPALLLALTISPLKALLVLAVICAAHFLEGNLVTPLVDRGIVKLPPALTLTLQCLLGSVAGLVGIALAAPVLAVILGAVRQRGSPPASLLPMIQRIRRPIETEMAAAKHAVVRPFRRREST